jgi:hypothetical protein
MFCFEQNTVAVGHDVALGPSVAPHFLAVWQIETWTSLKGRREKIQIIGLASTTYLHFVMCGPPPSMYYLKFADVIECMMAVMAMMTMMRRFPLIGAVNVVVVVKLLLLLLMMILGHTVTAKRSRRLQGGGSIVRRGSKLSHRSLAPLERDNRPDFTLARHFVQLECRGEFIISSSTICSPTEWWQQFGSPGVDVHRLVPADHGMPSLGLPLAD